jgi:hypothetical protein
LQLFTSSCILSPRHEWNYIRRSFDLWQFLTQKSINISNHQMIAGKRGRKYLQEVSFTLFTFLSFLLLLFRLFSIVLLYFLGFLWFSIIILFLWLLPLSQGCFIFLRGLFFIFIVTFLHLLHSSLYLFDIIAFAWVP